ncbi:hypothetical protein AC578_1028 [Pseudocercospora eumusae]|uniref:C2H2-type domain-containing protein n=1 Tax=Pseudocercospora eumusae TaxID=321146 RepID=A0A139HTJ9_9PEZI|nr:hypothetical protein AC578_1028 [Pseudocercospora eumusae]
MNFVSAPPNPHSYYAFPSTTTTTSYTDFALYEPQQIYNQALALLQQARPAYSQASDSTNTIQKQHPRTSVAPTSSPLHNTFTGARHDSAVVDSGVATHDWQTQQHMYAAPQYNSMGVGGPVASHQQKQGIKRQRSHARTPSASTVASTGPNSPYMNSASYPKIANTDHAPNSPAHFAADQVLYSKNLPTPSQTPTDSIFSHSNGYVPSASAHIPNAHLAMKNFGFDYHNAEDFTPDFAPSRQSMSSYGNDSPATPQSGAGDDSRQYNTSQNDYRQPKPNVQLFRTESQAFQDELYNPNQTYASAAPKSQPQPQNQQQFLSPHRNLINERLQTANLARSASPISAISRERSPFRDGSPLAPSKDWNAPDMKVGNAASMRQQQKDAAAEAEYAKHRVPLRREPTKTISPKDALLDYTGEDQPSLFQDSIPDGYKQHMGGTEQWQHNFMGQPSTTYNGLPTPGQQNMSFRNAAGTSADNAYAGFDFTTLPQSSLQNNPFEAGNYQAAIAAKMNQYAEAAPEFPAALPSMETSISDAGPPQSSQESITTSTTPRRPDDTRANTGTYTCTYHGCTQRFNSHNELQKHKRDYHRSQQKQHDSGASASASGTASVSPRSSGSPDPSTNGMTSAAILARNSQAGPHKCTRINPSTGKPCNTIFSRPYDLTRHEDTIHNNRKQKVRCPMCREEKTFSRNDALTRHMRVVHPEVEAFGKRSKRGD